MQDEGGSILTKSKDKVRIEYHHTERNSGVPKQIRDYILVDHRFKDFTIKKSVEDHEVDYTITCGKIKIGIERKEINDLVSSIQEKKIPHQIVKIIEAGFQPIFLVEGLMPDVTQTEMEWKSIYGFISWLSECDVVVHHTLDFVDTALRILNISVRVQKGNYKKFKVPVPVIKADSEILQRLMAIEGIGEELADKIRDSFVDNMAFLKVCEIQLEKGKSDLTKIGGIGKKTANVIAIDALRSWVR